MSPLNFPPPLPSPSPLPPSRLLSSSAQPASTPNTTNTGAPFDPVSGGFFSSHGAVAGAFALVGLEVAFISFMIILSHRLYRKNQRLQAQAQEMRIFQNHIHENPPAVDSSEYHNSRGAPPPTGRRPSWGKLPLYNTADEHIWYAESGSPAQGLTGQQFNVGDDALREAKHPYLVGINPGFVLNRRDRGGTLDRQTHRQDPRPPPDDKGPTTANHSWATIRSRAYSLFPNWRRLPRVPPSPSIHPATSPVVEDDGSARQLPAPTSIASPKTAAVLDQSYNRGASSKRLDPYRALVGPGTYMMIPLNSEDDQGRTTAPLVKSPFDGPCAPVPPPIPPKSPLRRLMPMQTIVDVHETDNKAE